MEKLVSAVITTYNYAHYLPYAIDSVLNQSHKNLEVVIVDDGSTDATKSVIKPYLHDARIRYIYQENQGQPKAKNRGVHESTGEVIAFLDADDIWMPKKLEKQLPCFDDEQVGVIYAGFEQIDNDNNVIDNFSPGKAYEGNVFQRLLFDNFICFSSSVLRRRAFTEVGGFDEVIPMAIDWDLWLRIAMKYSFRYVDIPLVLYRIGHAGQMSYNKSKRFECSDYIRKKIFALDNTSAQIQRDVAAEVHKRRAIYFANVGDFVSARRYTMRLMSVKPFAGLAYMMILKECIFRLLSNIKKRMLRKK